MERVSTIRVVLGLQEPLLQRGVEAILAEAWDCDVVASVTGAEELARAVDELKPDVAVADVRYHRADADYIPLLQRLHPEGAVLVLVDHRAEECVLRSALSSSRGWALSEGAIEHLDECCMMALKGKARGCVPREARPEELLAAVRTAARGEVAAGPWASARWLLKSLQARHGRPTDARAHITGREMEVIQLVADGLSNRAIAEELGIREQTIKNHLARVMKKLDVNNRVELALLATREHLVS